MARANAIEFEARDIELRRLAAEDFYSLPFDAVEVMRIG